MTISDRCSQNISFFFDVKKKKYDKLFYLFWRDLIQLIFAKRIHGYLIRKLCLQKEWKRSPWSNFGTISSSGLGLKLLAVPLVAVSYPALKSYFLHINLDKKKMFFLFMKNDNLMQIFQAYYMVRMGYRFGLYYCHKDISNDHKNWLLCAIVIYCQQYELNWDKVFRTIGHLCRKIC